jgi:hypothetical protein
MKIKINIKPEVIFTAKSKNEAKNKVYSYGMVTSSSYGSYITPHSRKDNFAIVANYQVSNRKTHQVKSHRTGKTKSTIIRKKLWTVRVYQIPIELLRIGDLVVKQLPRHFEITSRIRN